MKKIPDSEITPPEAYFSRRTLLRGGVLAASVAATSILYRKLDPLSVPTKQTAKIADLVTATTAPANSGFTVDEARTSLQDITHYNNFYEFSTSKDGVAGAARNFQTDHWKVEIGGMVNKPMTIDMDFIRRLSAPEERVYRMRCVEAWSMVVPWVGYSLSKLLERVEPKGSAKYVAFETLKDASRFPNQATNDALDWPYLEGLRMDEAMHPLTLLTTGLYGADLPPQDGAPVRMIIPWKYGFKGIKSIVKITLLDKQPPNTWNLQAPGEYGFYANVNPAVPHPRWSQATERRIGEGGRRPTLMFNGYEDQVGSLYAGMDLQANY